MTSPWFDPSNLMWLGPLAGATEAAWAGVLSILSFRYTKRGVARGLVFGHLYLGLTAAVALTTTGVIGWLQGQPAAIFGTFLGLGGPFLVAVGLSLKAYGNAYRLAELRRMQAMEI